ncbi:MAG: tRNA (adenosine(37)-N6)-threonylcarbamoyltransferase complex transferase subunit TsaD [Planctomycetes bacterium]|nr:tRNA (adenosine(37)-N6)-threonylcarbamoyltransferase complex transferase subunit TsaD [Planctomycetota bacterium]
MNAPLTVLALETSCDETAAAVVELREGRLVARSSAVIDQDQVHAMYGGVVPELASRAHLEKLLPAIRAALSGAGASFDQLDAVAVGIRPGLIGSLLVGTSAAKALAWSLGKPFLGVDHVLAHLVACHFQPEPPSYPALGLVASGGHTHFMFLESPLEARVVGRTRDDAAGEAFDKAASILQLGWPGGPLLEKLARDGNERAFDFRAGHFAGSADISLSGVKTAFLYEVRGVPGAPNRPSRPAPPELTPSRKADLAASFQRGVVQGLEKCLRSAWEAHPARSICAGGGVIRNESVRTMLQDFALREKVPLFLSPKEYCTDNAVMIGGLALLRLAAGERDDLSLAAEPLSRLRSR